jgi:hypothetical protein
MISNIFVHPEEERLRTGWRIFFQLILLTLLIVFIAPLLFGLGALSPVLAFLADEFLIQAVAIIASIYFARRWFDRRSLVSLGIRWDDTAIRDLLFGIFVPALLFGIIFLLEWALGWLEFEGFAWQQSEFSIAPVGYYFFAFILVGFYEELLSRGYQLQNLAEAIGLRWAIFASSAIFSLLHLANPSASIASVLGILAAGYFLAYPYLLTGSLWISIGLHIGWNFFEGPVFGFPVSGLETTALLIHSDTGPALITGAAFGPEAGFIVLPIMALGAGLTYLYVQGRQPIAIEEVS